MLLDFRFQLICQKNLFAVCRRSSGVCVCVCLQHTNNGWSESSPKQRHKLSDFEWWGRFNWLFNTRNNSSSSDTLSRIHIFYFAAQIYCFYSLYPLDEANKKQQQQQQTDFEPKYEYANAMTWNPPFSKFLNSIKLLP